MCAMAVPMVLLFEGAVLFAVVHDRRKARRRAEERAAERISTTTPRPSIDAVPQPLTTGDDSWGDTT